MSMADEGLSSGVFNSLRIAILGDASNYKSTVDSVVDSSKAAADGINDAFSRVGSFIGKSIGFIGVAALLDKSVNLAATLTDKQNVQAQILRNQLSPALVQQYGITKGINGNYSTLLSNAAMYQSNLTGMNVASITQAQTLFLTNKELANMFSTGQKINSGPLKGMNVQFNNAMDAASNMAALMGGNVASSARMLNRVLNDPAKRIMVMQRAGLQLSTTQINSIKTIEASQGKVAARYATLQLINSSLGGVAQAAVNPMERIQNILMNLATTFGEVLLPLINAFASALTDIIQPFQQMFLTLANSLGGIMTTLGAAIGSVFQLISPVLTMISGTLLPDILKVLQPILVGFSTMVGTLTNSRAMKTFFADLDNILNHMSDLMAGSLTQGMKQIVDMFNQMAADGQLNALFSSFTNVLETLAPILPMLTNLFVEFVLAMVPVLVKSMPIVVQILQLLANLVSAVSKILPPIMGFVTHLLKIGGVKQGLAGLLALWFTKRLWLSPVQATARAVVGLGKHIGKTAGMLSKLKSGGWSGLKTSLGGGIKKLLGFGDKGQVTDNAEMQAAMDPLLEQAATANTTLGEILAAIQELATVMETEGAGGGLGEELGGEGGAVESDLAGEAGSVGSELGVGGEIAEAGGGLGLLGGAKNFIKSPLTKLKGFFGRGAASGAEDALAAGGESVAGDAAAGAGEAAIVGGGEAAAEGGILAAGLGSAPETLGIGLAVAAAAAAYLKWHKAINHAVIGAGKFLYHGAEDVTKWGAKEGHHIWNGIKDVSRDVGGVFHKGVGMVTSGLHVAAGLAHGIGSVVGGFFGGIFGGGGGGSSSGGSGGQTYWLIRIAHHTFDTANLLRQASSHQGVSRMLGHPSMRKMAIASSHAALSSALAAEGGIFASMFNGSHEALRAGRGNGNQREVVINIEPNAFVIQINGNADKRVAQQIDEAMQRQFKEMLRTVKAMRS